MQGWVKLLKSICPITRYFTLFVNFKEKRQDKGGNQGQNLAFASNKSKISYQDCLDVYVIKDSLGLLLHIL